MQEYTSHDDTHEPVDPTAIEYFDVHGQSLGRVLDEAPLPPHGEMQCRQAALGAVYDRAMQGKGLKDVYSMTVRGISLTVADLQAAFRANVQIGHDTNRRTSKDARMMVESALFCG